MYNENKKRPYDLHPPGCGQPKVSNRTQTMKEHLAEPSSLSLRKFKHPGASLRPPRMPNESRIRATLGQPPDWHSRNCGAKTILGVGNTSGNQHLHGTAAEARFREAETQGTRLC